MRNHVMKKTLCIGVALTMMALPTAALAQGDPAKHDMSAMDTPQAADDAAKAYMDGMARMGRDMNAAMTGDADTDFAAMMIPHHQGAIDMAEVQLQYGKDPELRKLSEAIAAAQENEIAFMKGWLDKNGKPVDDSSAHAQHMPAGMAYMEGMAKMNTDMNAEMTGDPDRDFVVMMIPHHQGAIDMARVQLEYGKDPELRKLSEAIISAQESEIALMKEWLAKH